MKVRDVHANKERARSRSTEWIELTEMERCVKKGREGVRTVPW